MVGSALRPAQPLPEFKVYQVNIVSPPPQVLGDPEPAAPVVPKVVQQRPVEAPPKPQPKAPPVQKPTEQPKPKPSEMFPTFPSKAGQEKRRRASPHAPKRGEAAPALGKVDFSSIFTAQEEGEKGAGFMLKMA